MRRCPLILFLFILVVFSSCRSQKNPTIGDNPSTSRYCSDFPRRDATLEIERIASSVKKVYSVSSYTTYQFHKSDRITMYQILQGRFKNSAWGVISTSETVFGSGTILAAGKSKIVLLTCAHVVNSPDTLISYFETTDEDPTRCIQSISLKEKQENWVKDLSACGSFNVLASDDLTDIALLGQNCERLTDTVMSLPYPAGRARDLGWGSFVYIFGYPLGNQVVTHGITSPSPKRPSGEFFIDALLNKGYSGGIIMALRNGLPNFELVGMVKTVNSTREEFLKPASGEQRKPEWLPYSGEIFTGKIDHIQYGLNVVVTAEEILDFYKNNRHTIHSRGYNLDGFFEIAKDF